MAKNTRTASISRAGRGTMTFIIQRATAILLLMIAPWFALSAGLAAQGGYDGLVAFFAQPIASGVTGSFIVAACWHAQIGMHEIIEDYIHKPPTKALLSLLNTLVMLVAALAGLYGLAKLTFGI